jgi:predicted ATPase
VRIDRLLVRGFKNLGDVDIDFDAEKLETVVIGQNGTGKSNVIEAIATIFRDLEDARQRTPFAYHIAYSCRGRSIIVDHRHADPEEVVVTVDGEPSSVAALRRKGDEHLPNHVFGYYSGSSERLREIFDPPQRRYYDKAIEAGAESRLDPRGTELRRLFFVRDRYGALALLTYFAFSDEKALEFLNEHLGVEGFDSALLTLREPEWGKRNRKPSETILAHSDPRFWNARGIVRRLLDGLWKHALAPVRHEHTVKEDYRSKGTAEKQLYVYIKDAAALLALAKPFGDEQRFFAYLETLDLSDLVRNIRIWVRRRGADAAVPFHEISDGEKQLLSVLGMMRFAAHDESLFLLDEPDTHLNPAWKWSYLSLIKEVAGRNSSCHVIMTSHDPLTIASLDRSQVQVLYRDADGEVRAARPEADPKGLGVAGVLRQVFGMLTTLDPPTQDLVDERNALLAQVSELRERGAVPEELERRLMSLNNRLSALGLAHQSVDPAYDAYLRAVHRVDRIAGTTFTPEEIREQNRTLERLIEGMR